MYTKIEEIDGKDVLILYASEGKVLNRIGYDEIMGDSIALGYSYYIAGEKLPIAHKDVPEDFEEIDPPIDEVEEEIEPEYVE